MSADKSDPTKKDPQISSAEDLIKAKKGDVELSEEELKRVSGGLKYDLKEVFVTSYQTNGSGGGSSTSGGS